MAISFFDDYFAYTGLTESPMIYHRWTAISTVAALLGRNVCFPFGHMMIYPNMYTLLVGSPGARKGTAMKPASNALRTMEFSKLAPQRVSPERFLIEMAKANSLLDVDGLDLEKVNFEEPSEIYVVSEEFTDFIRGNLDFINLLTNLWDNLPTYSHPKIHGKSIEISEPTVNILAATTPQSIASTLPQEVIGLGFLSRFVLVYGENVGRKITFPLPPSKEDTDRIVNTFLRIRNECVGTLTMTSEAEKTLDRIYNTYVDLEDSRFEHYNTRRFTHLLKLCIVFAAMDYTTEVTLEHVIFANTLLHSTEQRMSKALGQFGKAKNSDVANTIVNVLRKATKPMKVKDIWKHVAQDLAKIDELTLLLRNLEAAERIMVTTIGGTQGFVAVHKTINAWDKQLMHPELLLPEERV